MLRYLPAAALVLTPVPAPAAPLAPTDKWHLVYQESSCVAWRTFGDSTLSVQPGPLGKTTRLVILGPARFTRTRQLDSLIELTDGGAPIKASSLVYGTAKKGVGGINTILPTAEAARVSNSAWLRISTLGSGPKSNRTAPSRDPIFTSAFAIGSTAALARELGKCLADLQDYWGMADGKLPVPAKPASFSLKGVFTGDDYPDDAMIAEQSGITKYMLMIDENGAVLDCVIEETSGVASIDQMGCQVMRERVKAKPALDAAGKPMKSLYEQIVHWQLAN